jgi:4-amino-4-deoxy-L-arabinose transferase-like glycosyltransferase
VVEGKKSVVLFFSLITLFRLVYINFVPLVPQEAYYWNYSEHLALSYFDHPPLTAWTIAVFTAIGGDHIFFIRLGSVLFSLGIMVLLYRIALELFNSRRVAFMTILAINCTVLFSIGATIITPDVPLLFFWTLLVYCLVKLRSTRLAGYWYFAGIALGLALLSKYTAVLIVPGIFLYILLSPDQRHWLKTAHPYLAILLSLVVFSPVIIWNYQNDWVSFMFQSSGRFSQMTRFRLDYFGQLIGSQMGMLTPYLLGFAVGGWIYAGKKASTDDRFRLLFWISFFTYLIFPLLSFRSLVKPNWMAPAYVTSIIAAVVWVEAGETKTARWYKKYFKGGLIMGLVIVVFMNLLPLFPILPLRRGDTWTGWAELAQRIEQDLLEMEENTFVFGHEYKIPSELAFYTSGNLQTHCGEIIGERGLQYTYWTDINELIGCDAIFITSDAQRYRETDRILQYFAEIEQEEPLVIEYYGRVFRTFYIYRCYNYKGVENSIPGL